ncbi:unnamed protein product [Paramecium octaurelia]|uniref:Tetratricopeptide repeat protein n=1 Tax=Paramecium octaurelia TaxID=43137 RepID=A0A8S1SEL9_PAROT|nr:unnamed protein product [Paramecium octaurelia]
MNFLSCKQLDHENKEIIGFCLNQNCQNSTQYCSECFNTTHSEHQKDCVLFSTINYFMKELIKVNNELRKQFNQVYIRIQNYFEEIQNNMDQEIQILENMTYQLQNHEYLAFKSQIHIIKQFYSKENENYKQQQLIELNKIPNKLKNMVSDQTKLNQQVSSDGKTSVRTNKQSLRNEQLNFEEAERLFDEGKALRRSKNYQEAIERFNQALSLNPQYVRVWINKALVLSKLKRFQEAIECYDQAISIDTKDFLSWNNKGMVLCNLNQHQEAIKCFDQAISINPKFDASFSNKGFALHQLKRYWDALQCYDQALSICINPSLLKRKADSLFELNFKYNAKQVYLEALQLGSNETDYINKQLSKL